MKKFIVALNSSTKDQDEAFQKIIHENGWGWWHWVDNFWIVTSSSTELGSQELYKKVQVAYPGVRMLISEMENVSTWWGFGPNSEEKNMFKWLFDYWN